MGLKVFNLSNIKPEGDQRGDHATLSVNGKWGLICFSKGAVRALGLKAGQGVEFFQDEESVADWFVRCSEGSDAIVLRGGNNSGVLRFSSLILARGILGAVQGRERYEFCRFPIQEKAMEVDGEDGYYLIITAKPVRARVRKG
jgi:hypothetical protein